jgi:hypothetical protein
MSIYGEYGKDGRVVKNPTHDAVTGKLLPLERSGYITQRVGKFHFVRYVAHQSHRVMDEIREQWDKGIKQTKSVSKGEE